jgi:prevent-host-death family protein
VSEGEGRLLDVGSDDLQLFSVKNTYTIARGQSQFAQLVRDAEKGGIAVVTRHEKPVAYLVSAERLASLMETRELLTNPDFRRILKADRAGTLKFKPFDPSKG